MTETSSTPWACGGDCDADDADGICDNVDDGIESSMLGIRVTHQVPSMIVDVLTSQKGCDCDGNNSTPWAWWWRLRRRRRCRRTRRRGRPHRRADACGICNDRVRFTNADVLTSRRGTAT